MTQDAQSGNGDGSWKEWSRWVRESIRELKRDLKELAKEVAALKIELTVLKVKVALWGFVGAALATGLIQIIVHYVKKGGL